MRQLLCTKAALRAVPILGEFIMKTVCILALSAVLLAGCDTPPGPYLNPLPPTARNAVHVEQVEVEWTIPKPPQVPGAGFEAEKADLVADMKASVAAGFQTSPAGAEAVVFKLVVTKYSGIGIYNTMDANTVIADVHVVRIADQKELAVYPAVVGASGLNDGLFLTSLASNMEHTCHQHMAENFAKQLRTRFDGE